jgi:hypothetical protein
MNKTFEGLKFLIDPGLAPLPFCFSKEKPLETSHTLLNKRAHLKQNSNGTFVQSEVLEIGCGNFMSKRISGSDSC